MNYSNSLPSLERVALIKITATLWSQDDIRDLLKHSYIELLLKETETLMYDKEKWRKIENKVEEKVQQLPQPKRFKEKISRFIRPIGLQIFYWMKEHNNCDIYIGLPSELCWSSQGTVDRKKTAEVLIEDENVPIASRYKLACIYCLENDIQELWNKMPKSRQLLFYRKRDPGAIRQDELVFYWTYAIKGEVSAWKKVVENRNGERCIPYEHAFQYAVLSNNKAAAEYFLAKLTSPEREQCLITSTEQILISCGADLKNCIAEETYADVLPLLLSQMNEEQQLEVFDICSCEVLNVLLDWPLQEFFIPTTNRVWAFLSEVKFIHLLHVILNKVTCGYKDYDYQNLFGDFWEQSPTDCKRTLTTGIIGSMLLSENLLLRLLEMEDIENVRLILKYASTQEKDQTMFSSFGQYACSKLICDGKRDLAKLFLQECISSRHMLMKFKEEFESRSEKDILLIRMITGTQILEGEENVRTLETPIVYHGGMIKGQEIPENEKERVLRELLQILEELIQKGDRKRALDEGNNTQVKKLCT